MKIFLLNKVILCTLGSILLAKLASIVNTNLGLLSIQLLTFYIFWSELK